jgi:formylmethanofuran dehydrogenase subunit E
MILNLEEQKLWERCADFHGHTCGGLAIGFQAARRAARTDLFKG